MKNIGKFFRELKAKKGYSCEQCGAPETETRPLQPYFIDGDRSRVCEHNVVVLCPGCCTYVRMTWPLSSGWEMGAPAWAINRGYFKTRARVEAEAETKKHKARDKAKVRSRGDDNAAGRRAGKVAAEILRTGKRREPRRGRKKK